MPQKDGLNRNMKSITTEAHSAQVDAVSRSGYLVTILSAAEKEFHEYDYNHKSSVDQSITRSGQERYVHKAPGLSY